MTPDLSRPRPDAVTDLKAGCCALLLILIAAITLAGWAPGAFASERSLIQSQAWRIDSDGQDTLEKVQQATDWQPLHPWKSWGFGTETVWIKIRLEAATNDVNLPWLVRVRPSHLDHLTLFDPTTGLRLSTGDAVPPGTDSLAAIHFTLQIPALPEERTIYLQMRSTSARVLQVEVLPFGQAQHLNRLQEGLMGLVVATSAVFAAWAAAQWWTTRERVVGVFAVKQIFATVWAFFTLGFARIVMGPWMPEGLLSHMASTINIWTVGSTLWFLGTLLKDYRPAAAALRANLWLTVMLVALPLLQWLGYPRLALATANMGVLCGLVIVMITSLSALPRRVPQPIPLSVLVLYLMVYSTLNAWSPLIHLGWIQESPVLFVGLAHAVLDGAVMFVLLQIRAHALANKQQRTTWAWQQSRLYDQAEQRHRKEQSQLFDMLAHEIRTPLTTLRMWMDAEQLTRERLLRAIADMALVIDRCVHTGQLADEGLKPDIQAIAPRELTLACIATCRNPDRVQFVTHAAPTILQSDAQMLTIALSNLLDNACKYSTPDSPILVTLHRSESAGRRGWQWEVVNVIGAAGLPEVEHLFKKYHRGARARRVSGSGLGLFLVKGLLELLQGKVRYEAQTGQAAFSIWVPEQPRTNRSPAAL